MDESNTPEEISELKEAAEDAMEEGKREKKTLKYQRGPIESTTPDPERAE